MAVRTTEVFLAGWVAGMCADSTMVVDFDFPWYVTALAITTTDVRKEPALLPEEFGCFVPGRSRVGLTWGVMGRLPLRPAITTNPLDIFVLDNKREGLPTLHKVIRSWS
jgi:hypothetical protein